MNIVGIIIRRTNSVRNTTSDNPELACVMIFDTAIITIMMIPLLTVFLQDLGLFDDMPMRESKAIYIITISKTIAAMLIPIFPNPEYMLAINMHILVR